MQKQLGNHKVKPSGGLWDKLNQELDEGSFEQKIQANVDGFELVPNSDTWQKIEAELPPERILKKRLGYFLLALLLLLFSAGLWVGYELKPPSLVNSNTNTESPDYLTNLPARSNKSAPNQPKKVVAETASPLLHTAVAKSKQPTPELATGSNIKQKPLALLPQGSKVHNRMVQIANTNQTKRMSEQPENLSETATAVPKPFIATKDNQQPDATLANMSGKQEKNAVEIAEQTNKEVAKVTADTLLEEDKPDHTPAAQLLPLSGDSARIMASGNNSKKQEQLNIDEEKPGKFSMLIMVGSHLSLNHLQTPLTNRYNMDENMALRNSLEKPRVDWSGGFYMDYMLSNKWRVAVGIAMLNFTQQFNYNLIPAVGITNGAGEQGVAVFNPTDSVVSGSLYNTRIRYSWTEIPVLLTYKVTNNKKWNMELQAGASYAILNAVDASIVSYDNTGLLQLKDKDAFPGLQNSVFVICNPTISYTLNEKVQIGMMPTFKYSLNSMVKNENWVQQHPYFIGMALSLRKRF